MTCEACATAEEFPALFQAGCKACEQRMMATLKQTKPKTCNKRKGGCGGRFIPRRPMQSACSPECAREMARAKREQDELKKARETRKVDKERREKLKTRSDYMKEAQRAFNTWVRARDYGKTCISCGSELRFGGVGGGVDAGHYRSVGSAPHLRFDERNCHCQCVACNRWGSGRAVDYRRGLLVRIGADAVAEIEADQTPRHYSKEDLIAIRDKYRKMANELAKERT